MKAKRILITYFPNGNMASEVGKEILFERLRDEMIIEGREVLNTTLQQKSKSVKFDDGSSLMVFPVGVSLHGLRTTHIFVDEQIKDITGGDSKFENALKSTLLTGEYEQYDTSGERVQTFSFKDGELKIN